VTSARFPLAVLPTPLTRLDRLAAALGRGPLWAKRDDLTGFGVAGNKARALEHLVGDALARGADVLVTGGGPDSNFVAAAALAAAVAGMDCELVVAGGAHRTTNLALAADAGAVLHPLDGPREGIDAAVERLAAGLAREGRRPLAVPRGGSTPVGAAGFAAAAAEVIAQWPEPQPPASVVIPVGSGGSVAGLLAGLAAVGADWPVLGVSVSRPPDEITATVLDLAAATAGAPPRADLLTIVDARGPGFGLASPADRAAAALVRRTEGLLLDDTYGAEAAAVLVEHLGTDPRPALFWLTGGIPSALAHAGEQAHDEEIRERTP
jgi:D-cysteine desulfhydrase